MAKRKKIEGLKWAKLGEDRPSFIPAAKNVKGAKRAGLRFEHRFAAYMVAKHGEENVSHGPWIAYEDKKGLGWCQPDVVWHDTDNERIVVFECKLTATGRAVSQLASIYYPVLRAIYPNITICLVQVCRNLSRSFDGPYIKMDGIKDLKDREVRTLWMHDLVDLT
jgi:hypothetical protein